MGRAGNPGNLFVFMKCLGALKSRKLHQIVKFNTNFETFQSISIPVLCSDRSVWGLVFTSITTPRKTSRKETRESLVNATVLYGIKYKSGYIIGSLKVYRRIYKVINGTQEFYQLMIRVHTKNWCTIGTLYGSRRT